MSDGLAPLGIMFDEDRGGPRSCNNLISFPVGGMVHKSTENAWCWVDAGSHSPGYCCTPSVFVEGAFRRAPVPDSKDLEPHALLTKCLGVEEYLKDGLTCLASNGLFQTLGTDGTYSTYVYEDHDEFDGQNNPLPLSGGQLLEHVASLAWA